MSRPIVMCHEMSQMIPIVRLVAAAASSNAGCRTRPGGPLSAPARQKPQTRLIPPRCPCAWPNIPPPGGKRVQLKSCLGQAAQRKDPPLHALLFGA